MSIKEIAKRTGASQATVSRVLNNPDHRCSDPKLRDKIWKAAMELHYVPNAAARDLKNGKQGDKKQTYYLQVLVTRSDVGQTDPFIEELLRVIESEIHKHLCILTHVWHRSVFSDERRCKKEDVNRIVADLWKETEGNSHGLIIIGKISKHAIPAIRKHFAHVVAVNRNQLGQQLDEVFCDGRKIAFDAVSYLISPMLTTVALPKEEMGRFAVLLLLDRIEGNHQSEVVMELKGKLLIRESVRKYGDNDWSDYVI